MDSVPLREVKEKVAEYSSRLLASDPRFRKSALLIHEDGTVMYLDSAFIMTVGEWVVCFTEHHGDLVYHYTDLTKYQELQPRPDLIQAIP